VNHTLLWVRAAARPKNLELLLDISPRTPLFVRSDSRKLRQVLINLIGNALKYTAEGSVALTIDYVPANDSAHSLVVFEVEDTGVGIAPADQSRIFEPFVQGGGTNTRNGTGLGLSISRHFIEILGGTITVRSILGRGSRFHVEVPAPIVEASEVKAAVSKPRAVSGLGPGQPDFRILIVEDRKENWLLLERLLRTVGFQVQVAEDGGQAIKTFRKWSPHFIWMDVHLPVLNGMEVARRIRELDGGRGTKIVAVTASAFASEREEARAAGFDDFLRKPYRPAQIFDCMARHLGVRYVYGRGVEASPADQPPTLHCEDLASLPIALRDELEAAVISLDRTRIDGLVKEIAGQNALLGRALAELAEKLAYTPILRAIASCKCSVARASA
jgi:CheY-like chemotaxis protein